MYPNIDKNGTCMQKLYIFSYFHSVRVFQNTFDTRTIWKIKLMTLTDLQNDLKRSQKPIAECVRDSIALDHILYIYAQSCLSNHYP